MDWLRKALVVRLVAVLACIAWVIWELCALQRARWRPRNFKERVGTLRLSSKCQ